MNRPPRLPAVLAYLLPVIGWLYIFLAARRNRLALYHLKQALGLCGFVIATLAGWAAVAWVLAWIPYMAVFSAALFALVVAAYLFGLGVWLLGLSNALRGRLAPLPLFGRWADRLPLR